MRESRIENALVRGVKRQGGEVRKYITPGRRHAPDRIVIWPGEWISEAKRSRHAAEIDFVELKAPGKKARDGQIREHRRLRALGCSVCVLDTLEKVDLYLRSQRSCS